jgi:hypothetical protein
MKNKITFILLLFITVSCAGSKEPKANTTPTSRIDNIESGANRVFKEID